MLQVGLKFGHADATLAPTCSSTSAPPNAGSEIWKTEKFYW
jgi:hypothetical protein